jgi:hypothetical protein
MVRVTAIYQLKFGELLSSFVDNSSTVEDSQLPSLHKPCFSHCINIKNVHKLRAAMKSEYSTQELAIKVCPGGIQSSSHPRNVTLKSHLILSSRLFLRYCYFQKVFKNCVQNSRFFICIGSIPSTSQRVSTNYCFTVQIYHEVRKAYFRNGGKELVK